MRKRTKRLLSTLLISATLLGTIPTQTAHAYINENGEHLPTKEFDPKNPAGWNQNIDAYPRPPLSKRTGNLMFGMGKVDSWTSHACMIFAGTKMLIQAGIVPFGTTPTDIHDKLYDDGNYQSNGFANYYTFTDSYPQLQFELWDQGHVANHGYEATVAEMKKRWEAGEYIIIDVLWVGGHHVINFDYIDKDGKIVVSDSAFGSFYLDDIYTPSGSNPLAGFAAFSPVGDTPKSTEGLSIIASSKAGKPTKIDGSLANDKQGTDDNESAEKAVQMQGGTGIWQVDEDAIPNMPPITREFLDKQVANGGTTDMSILMTDPSSWIDEDEVREDFKEGTDAATGIAKWKEEVSERKHTSGVNVARRTIMLVGVFAAILGAILNILYAIDRLNPFGVSFISLLTRGRVRSIGAVEYAEDLKEESKARLLTDKNIFFWVALSGFVASFLISGLAYEWFGVFINFVVETWNTIGGLWK